MKIACREFRLALPEPFVTRNGVTTEVRQSLLELRWQGVTGYGTARGLEPAALAACGPALADASPYELRTVLDRLAGVPAGARAAVDMAMHDLLGQVTGQPLHRLLGLAGRPLAPTARSIGAGSDEELIARARALSAWPVIKLKLTPADDGRRAGLLRSVYDGRIWVDGNGSWTPVEAVRVAEELHRHGVEMLEQPVAPGALADLEFVHRRSPVPVFADEDCVEPADVPGLAGRVRGVNIKLIKCGGLRAAGEMITLARAGGLQVMLGCKVESALGVTAVAQLAGLADHLDLDGHVGLLDDPFTGLAVDRGVVTLPPAPGVGATVRPHLLKDN